MSSCVSVLYNLDSSRREEGIYLLTVQHNDSGIHSGCYPVSITAKTYCIESEDISIKSIRIVFNITRLSNRKSDLKVFYFTVLLPGLCQ